MQDANESVELKLEGHIYYVKKDAAGNEVSKEMLDGETCLKLLVAVLDDALAAPILENVFSVVE